MLILAIILATGCGSTSQSPKTVLLINCNGESRLEWTDLAAWNKLKQGDLEAINNPTHFNLQEGKTYFEIITLQWPEPVLAIESTIFLERTMGRYEFIVQSRQRTGGKEELVDYFHYGMQLDLEEIEKGIFLSGNLDPANQYKIEVFSPVRATEFAYGRTEVLILPDGKIQATITPIRVIP